MNIWQIGLSLLGLLIVAIGWSCCAAAGRADDEREKILWLCGKPRQEA
jgi:hypothetical protein